MPSFQSILESYPGPIRWVENLQYEPEAVEALMEPLHKAGFKDFKLVGSGGNSFCIAPSDTDDYVFRITRENQLRPDDCPFFFQCGYLHEALRYEGDEPIEIEMLLRGESIVLTQQQKSFLLDEMIAAGWSREVSWHDALWKDVLLLSIRNNDGRVKTVPMITDTSVQEWAGHMMPEKPNSCSRNYISLQEQADRFNAIRQNDPRVKALIPEVVVFRATDIRPSPNTPSITL